MSRLIAIAGNSGPSGVNCMEQNSWFIDIIFRHKLEEIQIEAFKQETISTLVDK